MPKRAKMLLVKPPYRHFPVGLAYVASTLERHGVPYDYVDSYYERLDLPRRLAGGDYFALGAGGLIGDFFFFQRLFDEARALDPELPLILGGHIAKDMDPELMFERTRVDYMVIGEAEITLPQLLERIRAGRSAGDMRGVVYRGLDGRPVRTPPQERLDLQSMRVLPSFSFMDFSRWPIHDHSGSYTPVRVMTGRGCPGVCTYCSPTLRKFMPRRFEDIFEELDILIHTHKCPQIVFDSEILFEKKDDALAFLAEYRRRYDVPFTSYVRADVDLEVLAAMKEAGCNYISVGLETGSDDVLKRMCKGTTMADNRRFVAEAKRLRFQNLCSGIMVGNEDETEADIRKTLDFDREIGIDTFYSATVAYPGTTIYRRAVKKGVITDEYRYLGVLETLYNLDFEADRFLHKDWRGKPLSPNLSAIAEDRFVPVMMAGFKEYRSTFAMRDVRFTATGSQAFFEATCPRCGSHVRHELGTNQPYRMGVCCNGAFFNLFEAEALRPHVAEAGRRLRQAKTVVLFGDWKTMKFLLAYDVFGFDFERVAGVGSLNAPEGARHLYEDRHGNVTPNTRLLSAEAVAALNPDVVLVAELGCAEEAALALLTRAGVPAERIVPICPPGVLPEPGFQRILSPAPGLPETGRLALWPMGGLSRRILAEGLIPRERLVAGVDASPAVQAAGVDGLPVLSPEDFARQAQALGVTGILVTSGAYGLEMLARIDAEPALRGLTVHWTGDLEHVQVRTLVTRPICRLRQVEIPQGRMRPVDEQASLLPDGRLVKLVEDLDVRICPAAKA